METGMANEPPDKPDSLGLNASDQPPDGNDLDALFSSDDDPEFQAACARGRAELRQLITDRLSVERTQHVMQHATTTAEAKLHELATVTRFPTRKLDDPTVNPSDDRDTELHDELNNRTGPCDVDFTGSVADADTAVSRAEPSLVLHQVAAHGYQDHCIERYRGAPGCGQWWTAAAAFLLVLIVSALIGDSTIPAPLPASVPANANTDVAGLAHQDNGSLVVLAAGGEIKQESYAWHSVERQIQHKDRFYLATSDSRTSKVLEENTRSDNLIQEINWTAATANSEIDLPSTITRTLTGLDGGTVVVVSDGLSTAGSLDLRSLAPTTDGATLAKELKDSGAVRDLRGWDVIFTDVGGDDMRSQLPTWTPSRLALFWQDFLTTAGARASVSPVVGDELDYSVPQNLSRAPSAPEAMAQGCCDSPPQSVDKKSPDVYLYGKSQECCGRPSPLADKESRGVHLYRTSEEAPVVRPAPDSYSISMALDTAAFAPSVSAALVERVAASVTTAVTESAGVVIITGYAADVAGSTPQSREALGMARARVVAERFIAEGLSPGQVKTITPAGGTPPGETVYRGGKIDEGAVREMSRVDVLVVAR